MILTLTLNPALDALVFVEHLQWHAKNIVRQKNLFPSGKGFNVAKGLSALGLQTAAVGFVGRADISLYEQTLSARGIRLALTPIAATRTNLKLIEQDTGLETEINEPGAEVSPFELDALSQSLRSLLQESEWLILSGSVAPGIAPGIYRDFIREAAAAGVNTLLDTSGEPLRDGISAAPTILRINRAELDAATGIETDSFEEMAAAASSLLAQGIVMMVVSLGPEGALLVHKSGGWLAQPPRLTVVNAVGAGDIMSAGIVEAWQRGLEPPSLLRCATALASASVLTLESGDVDRRVARELEPQVAIRSL
ncbi:MAG: 1-phosphofructokinase family hexose kinase [Anaerolineae bacterium]